MRFLIGVYQLDDEGSIRGSGVLILPDEEGWYVQLKDALDGWKSKPIGWDVSINIRLSRAKRNGELKLLIPEEFL